MNWIALLFALEMGVAPFYNSLNVMEDTEYIDFTNYISYVQLDTEIVILDHLFIGGGVKTYIQGTGDITNWHTFESDYIFKTGLRFKNIEAGFRHFCLHPVRPYEHYYQPQSSTDAGYEEFYVRISN